MEKSMISIILKRLMFEHGIKPMELARRTKVPQPTVHRIVSGNCQNPHQGSLAALAQYFNISVAQLKGFEPIPGITTESVQGLKKIPIISFQEAAVWPTIMDDYKPIHTLFTEGNVSAKAFALLLNDNAMFPLFSEGSKIVIDPEKTPKNRSYVLVLIHNQQNVIFRQLITEGEKPYLKSLSPDLQFQPLFLKEQDRILGVLTEARKSYDE